VGRTGLIASARRFGTAEVEQEDMPTDPNPTPDWPARLAETWTAFHRWLMRPRVRLSVTGVTLLFIGGLLLTNSVWTLPLVIVGALMVAIAWMGHRLEGRFAVEWGEAGTELAFRASIKAAHPELESPSARSLDVVTPARSAAAPVKAEPEAVIEGEAHTVEIDVAELKALIAAVESAETSPPRPATAAPDAPGEDIRVTRVTSIGERRAEAASDTP
jgi:hypothetical protein